MKRMSLCLICMILAFPAVLIGCTPTGSSATHASEGERTIVIQNAYAPQEGDEKLNRGTPIIDNIQWDAQAGVLTISGNLPTPCEELRVSSSQTEKELSFEVYSLSQPDSLCAQVLQPFEAVLKLENFSTESMTLLVNGNTVK